MGFDLDRFVNPDNIDDELKCGICRGVLQDPLFLEECQHSFCKLCIEEWFKVSTTQKCPIDRNIVLRRKIKPLRPLNNLLRKLKMKCNFASNGCEISVSMENLAQHMDVCQFDPTKMILCERGCDLMIRRSKYLNHDCLAEVKNRLTSLQQALEAKNLQAKRDSDTFKNGLKMLKEKLVEIRTELEDLNHNQMEEKMFYERRIQRLQAQKRGCERRIRSLQTQVVNYERESAKKKTFKQVNERKCNEDPRTIVADFFTFIKGLTSDLKKN